MQKSPDMWTPVWYISHYLWSETQRKFANTAFNFVLEYAIRRIQTNQQGLKLNGTYQLVVYGAAVIWIGESMLTATITE